MGKHSAGKHSKVKVKNKRENKTKSKTKLKVLIFAIIVIILAAIVYMNIEPIKDIIFKEEEISVNKTSSIKDHTTVENRYLVMKSLIDYNKIIEYKFEKSKLQAITIYEQFEEKEEFETKKKNYERQNKLEIKNIDEENLSIEFQEKDLGDERELLYEQIYEKYLVQIIGAYKQI